jgi:DtxR family transcriptional regulator, Mn-dependent transcriptional regulator
MGSSSYTFCMHHHINDVWKKYEEHEITHSIVHYLFSIDALLTEKGYARAVDIAKMLGITPGSCSISLRKLIKK